LSILGGAADDPQLAGLVDLVRVAAVGVDDGAGGGVIAVAVQAGIGAIIVVDDPVDGRKLKVVTYRCKSTAGSYEYCVKPYGQS
jgi:hypothetical protein